LNLFLRVVPIEQEEDQFILTHLQMLEATRNPVARLEAQYHGVNASVGRKVDSDDCGNLEDILHLSVGARVLQRS
jgi:hypothetical protein